jgi:hypothetical protein
MDVVHTFLIKSPRPIIIDGVDDSGGDFIDGFTVPMSDTFVTSVWLETV